MCSGFDYALSDITCPVFKIAAVTATMTPPNGIDAVLSNLNLQCGGQYYYVPHGTLRAVWA